MRISNFRHRAATLATAAAVFVILSGNALAAPADDLSDSALAAPGANLISSALSKLTRPELSALLAGPLAVSQAEIEGADTSGGRSLEQVLAYIKQVMERYKGPLKWLAADGTEFDCYGDYVAYQWGGYGLPCN
jgi:hypothetical protein